MAPPNGDAPDAPETLLGAVGLKLPPFWRHDPQIWFAQAEAQFSTRNITAEATKYAHVIATLPPEVAQDVRDILISPPAANPYTTLKQQLVTRTTESEQRMVQMLLTEEELGDRKPSQFLRRLEQLVGDKTVGPGILRQLFLKRMPPNVRLILASTSDALALSDLAALADKIIEAHIPTVNTVGESNPSLAQVRLNPSRDHNTSPQGELVDQVATLTKLVKELTTTVGRLQRDRSRSRSRNQNREKRHEPRALTPSSSPNEGAEICWYHARFGTQAHKCQPPCKWSNEGNE